MPSEWENNSSSAKVSTSSVSSLSASSSTATSPEPNANGNNNCNSSNNNNDSAKNGHGKDCALKASTMSHDPTQYVARARVTRPTPPKPSCNPMQFVQIKPCNLYQSAQQQLKKAEEIKKVKEVKKEEPEDWQNNLDNWKSSRRKRVEHIIDRVVEVKKLELEEFDRQRRKSKTFSEMMEERGERGRTRPKLQSLDVYNEDEANDLSDLGIGTSSASGKSSISEDCETHSIVSEPAEVENLSSFDVENNSCQPCNDNHNRDRISSPGYETSSTAPVTSPVPYEYTYEGAIEDYKSRVSKATASSIYKKPSESNNIAKSMVFERKSIPYDDDDTESKVVTVKKEDLPKVDISKKRELFEKPEIAKRMVTPSSMQNQDQNEKKPIPSEFANVRSIKDRLCSLERKTESTDEPATGILSGEITSIKERLQCLEQQKQQNSVSHKPNTNKVVAEVVAVPPLKERLSCLQNAVTKEEVVKKPIVLVDEYQLEMLKNEEIARRQLDTSKDDSIVEKAPSDDSGINTTDEKIDHDALTTEDEDEDNEPEKNADALPTHDEKVPASASVNEIQGEFDSSVSLLQSKNNLNTPTVVSSVEKPIVVDVGGGSTLNNSGKVIRSDENGEVNHAQNLLKMFKMAFDGDEVVEEKILPIDVSKNIVDRMKLGNVGKQESEGVLQTAIAPWQSQVNRVSKIPQAQVPSHKRPVEPLSKELKKPSFERVTSIEEILKDDSTAPNSTGATGIIPKSKDSHLETPEVSIKQVETPRVDVEKSKIPITSQNSPTTPSNDKNHEMGSHLILNIDNSQQQKKSQIPVASKSQPNSPNSNPPSPSVVIRSQNIQKPSSPALAHKDQNVQKPSSPALARNPNVQKPSSPSLARQPNVQKPSSPALARQPNVQTPSSPALARNKNQKIDSPIYENLSFDVDISRPSGCVGLKKVVANNGRIEIFNSKSMAPKPKSPEMLPRVSKSSPNGDLSSQIQSKDFQQSAVSDFFKDLESWQPKIVAEQPKDSAEPVYSVKPDSSISNDLTEKQVVASDPKVISKSIESEKGAISTPKSEEILKASESGFSKKSTVPLPFESCVDILKSFLEAERSYPNSYTKPESVVSKESNQVDSRASDKYLRQETVVEVPCSKLDVKDLPDPNFIRTPCIDVDCGDKVMKDSIIASRAQIRDSLSSAGDSSPSSEITVIFKPNTTPTPGSPTPNKSSLMQIANRVASPAPVRRDPLSRQQPVTEKPCLKLDVKDLPDPNFIKTSFIDVQKKALTECSSRPSSPLTPSSPNQLLHKTNADILKQTCEELSATPPLSPVLGRELSAEKPNFLIARVEVVETKIKVTTTNDGDAAPPPVPSSSPPSVLPGSPKAKPKSAQNSKPKNIFEFLKKNFQSKSDTPEAEVFEPISVDNSKFYVPSDVIASPVAPVAEAQSNNGVNIEITKTITTDAIVEQTDDELNLSEEINEILDEEISKLVVDDAKL